MDNYLMNDYFTNSLVNRNRYNEPNQYYDVLYPRSMYGNNYQQLGAMAENLMGGTQDPRLQQFSQMLQMYQQGLR